MGQGTSKYRKITRTPQTGENAGKKLWYATAVSDREMSFEESIILHPIEKIDHLTYDVSNRFIISMFPGMEISRLMIDKMTYEL